MTTHHPKTEVGTVSMIEMAPEQIVAARACVDALKALPFPEAMTIVSNILCRSCHSQGVPRETVIRLVVNIWDAMVALETTPKERA